MQGKEIVKYGIIAVLVYAGWMVLNRTLSGVGRRSAPQSPNPGYSQYAPNYYAQGIYGPLAIPSPYVGPATDYTQFEQSLKYPFYSSPDGGGTVINPGPGWGGGIGFLPGWGFPQQPLFGGDY